MFFLSPERRKPINYKTILLFSLPDWAELTERGLLIEARASPDKLSCYTPQLKYIF